MGILSAACWRGEGYTNIGKVRDLNEDAVFYDDQQLLWGVADGLGGHDNGDYASQLLVSELENYRTALLPGIALSRLRALLARCNSLLVDKASRAQVDIIGCTVALLSLHGHQLVCSWSGDSRIYRLRNNELLLLTRDHNYSSSVEDRDLIQFPQAPMCNKLQLTAAIGGEPDVHLEHCLYALHPGDLFLICTDGLYKEVPDAELREILCSCSDAHTVLPTLTKRYFDRGARDNVGMVYVHDTTAIHKKA